MLLLFHPYKCSEIFPTFLKIHKQSGLYTPIHGVIFVFYTNYIKQIQYLNESLETRHSCLTFILPRLLHYVVYLPCSYLCWKINTTVPLEALVDQLCEKFWLNGTRESFEVQPLEHRHECGSWNKHLLPAVFVKGSQLDAFCP